MKKFSKKRLVGARRNQFARWNGAGKILSLLSRTEHSEEVESVVAGFYPTDLLVTKHSL